MVFSINSAGHQPKLRPREPMPRKVLYQSISKGANRRCPTQPSHARTDKSFDKEIIDPSRRLSTRMRSGISKQSTCRALPAPAWVKIRPIFIPEGHQKDQGCPGRLKLSGKGRTDAACTRPLLTQRTGFLQPYLACQEVAESVAVLPALSQEWFSHKRPQRTQKNSSFRVLYDLSRPQGVQLLSTPGPFDKSQGGD